ncbi:MAG: hypothetical protein AABX55_02475 [Nanoarchaeota archaeon]
MKYKLIKQKALFQIFLIISLSFYTSLSLAALNQPVNYNNPSDKENKITYFDLIKQDFLPSVDAQAPTKVCCEKTKTDSEFNGLSCVFTEKENCDLSVNSNPSAIACPQTDYCAPGVCILSGVCQDNVEKRLCEQERGQWRTGTSATISQCQVGCCDLPSGATITSQAQCADKVKEFPDIRFNDVFKPDIKDQLTCSQQSRSGEEGCCVLSDQCSFGTRKECNDLAGDFKLNTLCSNPSLGCQVTAKHSTTCYQNKVYWTDSASNRENVYDGRFDSSWAYINWLVVDPDQIAKENPQTLQEIAESGNCEYGLGTTCDQVTNDIKNYLRSSKNLQENDINKIQNQCISLDCQTTFDNPRIPWDDVPRKNGESWCSYESVTGNGEDLVGARHYLRKCQNGIEVVEECSTRRKEICVQNDVPSNLYDNKNSLTYAKCVPNNWQLCLAANSEDESCGFTLDEAKEEYYKLGYPQNGQQHPVGPCDVFSENDDTKDEYKSCILKTICRKDACENQLLGQCYFNKGTGLCAPSVPPGTLGKEEDFEELTDSDIGFVFECKEIWVNEAGPGDWDCEANCDCSTKAFADSWNDYCKSLGDFGAKYSVVGRLSTKGFFHTGPISDNADGNAHKAEGLSEIPRILNANKPLTGDFYSLLSTVDQITSLHFEKLKDPDFKTKFLESFNTWAATVPSGIILTNLIITALLPFGVTTIPILSSLAGTLVGVVPFIGGVPIKGQFILAAIIIFAALYGLLQLLFPAEQNEVTYKVSCEPWVAPEKGRDCNKCNDKSLFATCDEYLCQSLGKSCKLLNEGFPGNETCVWANEGDTLPPIIAPLILPPFTEQDIRKEPESTGFIGGYKFIKNITAFTSIEVGIQIIEDPKTQDNNAECKISRDPRFDYEEGNIDFFDNSLTKTKHNRKVPIATTPILPGEDRIELEAGKVNAFYVKCKDANDNVNLKSYFIEIPVSKGPDTAPPEIKSFSIKNNAFMPYNLNQTPLTIYIEDQSGIANSTTGFNGGCKYSTVDQSYDLMPFNMSCSQRRDPITLLFTCATTLKLKPNQDNVFYFRCKDLANNINPQSMPPIEGDSTIGYHLFGTKPLKITKVGPTGKVLTTEVNLTMTTSEGAEDGKSACSYSLTKAFGADSIKFSSTDASKHETLLSLGNEKDYKFYLWCRDVAGNEDDETIEFHTTTPEYNITDASPDNVKLFVSDVQLKVTIIGGVHNNGDGTCRYEGAGTGFFQDKTILEDETIHTKNITLQDGVYNVNLICSDQFKSDTKKIKFEVDTLSFPRIIRLYKQNNLLNIILDEAGECRYTTDQLTFNYDDVTNLMVDVSNTHKQLGPLTSDIYYVKCKSSNTDVLSPIYTIYP